MKHKTDGQHGGYQQHQITETEADPDSTLLLRPAAIGQAQQNPAPNPIQRANRRQKAAAIKLLPAFEWVPNSIRAGVTIRSIPR